MGKRPSFIKILLGNFSESLRIPPAFSRNISVTAPPEVILKGPSGCQWRVKLSGTRSYPPAFYLEAGWDKFVKDHTLHEHDLLLFKYDGGMHFTVLIFDKTACEREDAFIVEQNVIDVKRKSNFNGEKNNAGKAKKRSRAQFERGNSVPVVRNVKKMKREIGDQLSHAQKMAGCKGDPYLFTSKFPFFVKILPPSCFKGPKSMIYIPSTFHGYLKRQQMILLDPRGKKWPVSVRQSSRGRIAFVAGGWHAFCKATDLKVGDTCIFELRESCTLWVKIYPC